jgi:hypothetical protein
VQGCEESRRGEATSLVSQRSRAKALALRIDKPGLADAQVTLPRCRTRSASRTRDGARRGSPTQPRTGCRGSTLARGALISGGSICLVSGFPSHSLTDRPFRAKSAYWTQLFQRPTDIRPATTDRTSGATSLKGGDRHARDRAADCLSSCRSTSRATSSRRSPTRGSRPNAHRLQGSRQCHLGPRMCQGTPAFG